MHYHNGSTLVVTLIMLLSVTMLGILSVQGTASEQQITRNLQFYATAFSSTNSEVENWYSDIRDAHTRSEDLRDAMLNYEADQNGQPNTDNNGNPITLPLSVDPLFVDEPTVTQNTFVQYVSSAPGSKSISFSGDSSAGRYIFHPFVVTSTGTKAASTSNQMVGVTLRASTGK